ncbi:MAG: hypothetical protein ACN4GZ_04440 [Acidimicrobiales bacterium]
MFGPLSRLVPILALALVLSSCTLWGGDDSGAPAQPSSGATTTAPQSGQSSESSPSETDGATTTEPGTDGDEPEEFFVPEPRPGELFELLGPEDRIVVQSAANNLSILTYAGEIAAPTANDATQPVFSADGSVLAWTTLLSGGATGGVAFADVGADGSLSAPDVVAAPVISFYSVFAPGSSDRLAVLGNSRRGVGVAVVDRRDVATEVLDEGVPYFFVWNPEGTGFVGHVDESLRQFDIDSGEGRDAFEVMPSFRVPGLTADGATVYVVTQNLTGGSGMSEVLKVPRDSDGTISSAGSTAVARFDGLGSLTMSPDSSRVAISVEGALSTARVAFQSTPALDRGLHILDTSTDEVTTITTSAVLGAFWAPNSELVATVAFDLIGDGNNWARWTVFDMTGAVVSRSPRFLLSRDFVGAYLPFFDQYAESVSLWSPDSTRFVYSGESMAGDSGIWLHQLPFDSEGPKTYLVGEGVVAFWSP